MSRVKENYLRQQEDEFALDLSYAEWLRENFSEPSEVELDTMEQDFGKKPYFAENRIITHKPLNNPQYQSNFTTGA